MAYRVAAEIGPPVDMQGKGMGCGCAGLGCTCGGGLGLFDSGMDLTTWGISEWSIVATGVYALFSLLGDTRRGARRIKGAASGAYRGAKGAVKRNPGRRKARRR